MAVVLSSKSVLALTAKEVLGDLTSSQNLSIPPTTEGPGLVLPNSPIFFMDKLKQEFRLVLALTPEQKARVHSAVAGERLAELQFMLAKKNTNGIRVALQGVSDHLKQAASNVTQAKLRGKDVGLLAKSINDSIKDKQQKLSVLEKDAVGEMRAQVQVAREGIKIAKIEVEDNLPTDLLVNEILDDLGEEVKDGIGNASESAMRLSRAINALTQLNNEASSTEAKEVLVAQIVDLKNISALLEEVALSLQKEAKKKPASVAGAATSSK